MTTSQAGWLFHRLDNYFAGWTTVSQADCLFFAAWMAFSPRLIGPTILTLIPPDSDLLFYKFSITSFRENQAPSKPAKWQKRQCGGVYFLLYGIVYFMPIQQKLTPPVLLFSDFVFRVVCNYFMTKKNTYFHSWYSWASLNYQGGSRSKSSDRSAGAKTPSRRRKTSNQPAKQSSSPRNSHPAGGVVIQPANNHSACWKIRRHRNLVYKIINFDFSPFFSPLANQKWNGIVDINCQK